MTYKYLGQDIITPLKITSNEPSFSTDTVSLKVRRIKQGAQRWELQFAVKMQDATDFLVDTVSNFQSTTSMQMPQLNVKGQTISSGTSEANISVSGDHLANTDEILIVGMDGTINKGRFVKFASHNKIYLVTKDFTGTGKLSIYPSLRTGVSSGDPLMYRDSDSILFTSYRDISDANGITYTDGVLSEAGTINLIEAL